MRMQFRLTSHFPKNGYLFDPQKICSIKILTRNRQTVQIHDNQGYPLSFYQIYM